MDATIQKFFTELPRAEHPLLALDYDGTLAPFVDPKDAARAWMYPGVVGLLTDIMATPTKVVVSSGRALDSIAPLLYSQLVQMPEVWGSHGWERRLSDGRKAITPVGNAVRQELRLVETWRKEVEDLGGYVEVKPISVVFHSRGLSQRGQIRVRQAVHRRWDKAGLKSDLEWHFTDGGIEIRPRGRNKGDVIKSLLGPGVLMAYLGDDTTDEDAFRAIKGKGLGVLVRPEQRKTDADVWIPPPTGLLWFLRQWKNAMNASRPFRSDVTYMPAFITGRSR